MSLAWGSLWCPKAAFGMGWLLGSLGQGVTDLVGSVLLHPPESCESSKGQFVG